MIKDRLLNLPGEIEELKLGLFQKQEKASTIKEKLKMWELVEMDYISNELDEKGKAKFSNDTKRQAELQRRKDESEDYFEHLVSEIQEIRASERRFYQKITDIYATAVDYSKDSKITRDFFASVQNKMHYAIHGNTAAEVITTRANHKKDHMGLTSWRNAPEGKIVKTDVSIAKNYLAKHEAEELNEIVTMYLDYATRQARRHIPMTMADWAEKLDAFLKFNDAEILSGKGKVTAKIAKTFAESEFEKYRIIQDSLYKSDFDKLMEESIKELEKKDE